MGNCEMIVGAIIAGGQSKRMGVDKVNIPLNGLPMLDCMREKFIKSGINKVYISHPDHLPDIVPHKGPLSGIHSVINAIDSMVTSVIFVPVDMPGLYNNKIQKLAHFNNTVGVTHFEGYPFPFRLEINPIVLAEIESRIWKDGDLSLQSFQASIPNEVLPFEPNTVWEFMNLNSLGEFNEFSNLFEAPETVNLI